jgi:H+/Cl- antiporter ClcA/CBS domain-containing protein
VPNAILRPLSEEQRRHAEQHQLLRLCGLGCGVGFLAGSAALVLQALVFGVTNFFYFGRIRLSMASPDGHTLGVLAVVLPVLGGLAAGLLARYGTPAVAGCGLPQTMAAVRGTGRRLPARLALLKPLAAGLAVGTGAPLGTDGPSLQTGGALGSLLARLLRCPATEANVLVAAGAAAGLAAAFGTAAAALMLAVELLLVEFRARSLVPVALASITGAALHIAVGGATPLASVPGTPALGTSALLGFVLLGLGAGLASAVLGGAVSFVQAILDRLTISRIGQPVLGGVIVGLAGLACPFALGPGLEHLPNVLAGRWALGLLLLLVVCKGVAWAAALASGQAGGSVAPLLLLGAAVGTGLAHPAAWILPEPPAPALWAVVGMAAVVAGTLRTPLTAMILAVELTQAASVFLPALLACAVSVVVARGLRRASLLTAQLARDGVQVSPEYDRDVLADRTVGEVMTTEVTAVLPSLPVRRLAALYLEKQAGAGHRGYPVVDDKGRLVGLVTRTDLPEHTLREELDWLLTADIMTPLPLLVAHVGEPLRDAAERMLTAGVGQLPVVTPEAPDRLVGLLARGDVLQTLAARPTEEPPWEQARVPPGYRKAA